MKLIYRIASWIIILFGIFGSLVFGIIVHEYVHYFDFRNIDKESDELCVLPMPTSREDIYWNMPAGYYAFTHLNQEEEIEIIDKRTEVKARLIGIIPTILFFIALLILSKYSDERDFE